MTNRFTQPPAPKQMTEQQQIAKYFYAYNLKQKIITVAVMAVIAVAAITFTTIQARQQQQKLITTTNDVSVNQLSPTTSQPAPTTTDPIYAAITDPGIAEQLVATTKVKPPLIVSSQVKVDNLNASLLDGHTWEDIKQLVTEPMGLQTSYEAGGSISTNGEDLTVTLNAADRFVVAGSGSVVFDNAGTNQFTGLIQANGGMEIAGGELIVDADNATLTTDGDLTLSGDLITSQTTASVFNTTATTLNIGGAATVLSLGATNGTTTINNELKVSGDLTASDTVSLGNGDNTVTLDGSTVEIKSASSLKLSPNDNTNQYISLSTLSNNPGIYFGGVAATNDPGIRLNYTSGKLEFRDQNSSTWQVLGTGSTAGDTIWTKTGSQIYPLSGNTLILDSTSGDGMFTGNVGVGTTAPGYKLEVSGTGYVSGLLTLGAQATTANHAVRADRSISSGNGLTGGGNLTANRTLSINSPTCSGTDKLQWNGTAFVCSADVGFTNPMTTAGDIIYGGASGSPARLAAAGNNGYVLKYNTGTNTPYWAADNDTTYSAGNGMSLSGTTFSLGGLLSSSTDVSLQGHNLTFSGTGNVGIGTTTPGYTLEVNGTLNATTISGSLVGVTGNISMFTNDSGYITDGNTNWDNSYGFITASSTDTLTNKSGNISMWTNDSGYITDGNTNWDNSYGFITNDSSVDKNELNNAGILAFTWSDSEVSDALTINNGLLYAPSSGNVGVGTTNPGAKFEVDSGAANTSGIRTTQLTSASPTATGNGKVLTVDGSGNIVLVPDDSGAGTIPTGTQAHQTMRWNGSAWSISDNLVNTDTNVGIGTTNPGYTLDVNGTMRVGTLAAGGTNTVITHSSGALQTRNIDSRVWGTTLVDGSSLAQNYIPKVADGDTVANSLLFDDGTNIGVGTTNPGFKLDVNGAINGTAFYVNGSQLGPITAGSYVGQTSYWDGGSWADSSNIFNNNTNVGIGTTNPGYKFDVQGGNLNVSGNIYTNGVQRISSTGALSNVSGNISLWTNDSGYITDGNTNWDNLYGLIDDGNINWDNSYGFITASSTDTLTNKTWNGNVITDAYISDVLTINNGLLYAPTTGNVGIGTTNPGYKLEVSGSGHFSQALSLGTQATTTSHAVRADRNISAGVGLTGGGNLTADRTLSINSPTCSGTDKLQWNGTAFVCSSDVDTDTNNYSTGISFSGTSTKTLTLTRNGLTDLTATFSDIGFNNPLTTQGDLMYGGSSGTPTRLAGSTNNGYVLKYNTSTNAPYWAADNDTTYTATNGLTLNAGAFELGGTLSKATTINLNSNNLLFSGTGNVGIGTTNPGYKLDVNGAINATSLSIGGSQLGVITAGTVSGQTTYWNGSAWTASNNLFNNNTNVGIGTTNPGAKFDVGGISGEMARFASGGGVNDSSYVTIGGRALFGYYGTTTNAVIQGIGSKGIDFNVNNGTFGLGTAMTLSSGGNLGIGTTDPGYKLDVAGTIHGGISDTTTGLMALAGSNTTEGGQINLELAADYDNTFNSWNIDIYQDDLRFWSSDAGTVNAMTAEGQFRLPRTGSTAGLLLGGDALLYRDAANYLRTPDSLVIDGNVGIGTTNPDQKLEIAGGGIQLNSTYGLGFMGDNPYDSNVTSADAARIYFDNSILNGANDALVIEKTDANGANPDGGIVFTNKGNDNVREISMVIQGDGNVGVGITNPAFKLEVHTPSAQSDINISTNVNLGSGNTTQLTFTSDRDGTPSYASIGQFNNGDLRLSASGNLVDSHVLISSSSGNVGIGTTNPSSFKLQIAGNIGPAANDTYDLGSDSLRFASAYIGPSTLHIGTSVSDEYTIGYDTTNNRLGFNVNGSGSPEITFDSAGNVGIGTTNPTNKLTVEGTSITGSAFTGTTPGIASITGDDYTSDDVVALDFRPNSHGTDAMARIGMRQTGSGSHLLFGTSNNYASGITNTAMAINSSGNIGIGTTNPTEKLHISGGGILMPAATAVDNDSPALMLASNDDFLYDGEYINHYAFGFHDFSGGANSYVSGYSGIDFFTNGAPQMRIGSNGNVGIGTTTLGQKLTVAGNVAANGLYYSTSAATDMFGNVNGSGWGVDALNSGNWDLLVYNGGSLYFNQALFGYGGSATITTYDVNENLAITPNGTGKVGIGIAAPATKLNVLGTIGIGDNSSAFANSGDSLELVTDTTFGGVHDNHTGVRMFGFDMNGWGTAKLGIQTSNNWGTYETSAVIGNDLTYFTGNIGIGNNNPTEKLVVGESGLLSSTNADATVTVAKAAGGATMQVGADNSRKGYLRWHANNFFEIGTPGSSYPTVILGGNVGIGYTDPSAPFVVKGDGTAPTGMAFAVGNRNVAWAMYNQSSERLCHTGSDSTATQNVVPRDCSGSPGDYAEYYGTIPTDAQPGDVVSLDENGKIKVRKSNTPYDHNLVGVISTWPNDVIGKTIDPSDNPHPVALNGRVPTKVSLENGPIKVGDYLTASSIPGVAMKATKAGFVIGQALENYDGSFILSPETIKTEETMVKETADYINPRVRPPLPQSGVAKIVTNIHMSWYDPDAYLNSTGDMQIVGQESNYHITTSQGLIARIGTFSEAVIAKLNVGLFTAKEAKVEKLTVNNKSINDLVAEEVNKQLAALPQTTTASPIPVPTVEPTPTPVPTPDEEITVLSNRVTTLETLATQQTASIAGITTELELTAAPSRLSSLETLVASLSAMIQGEYMDSPLQADLTVPLEASTSALMTAFKVDLNAHSVLTDLILTADMVTANVINVNEINPLDLKLSLVSGLVTLDKSGNLVTIAGDLKVTGMADLAQLTTASATISGTLTAPIINELASKSAEIASQSADLAVRNASLETLTASLSAKLAELEARMATISAQPTTTQLSRLAR